MTYVMNDAEKELVEALESGRYKQGKEYLRPTKGTFCCLGVKCDLDVTKGIGEWDDVANGDEGNSISLLLADHSSESYKLPDKGMESLNWSHNEGKLTIPVVHNRTPHSLITFYTLAELNDSGFTFHQIADVIRAGLVEKADEVDPTRE